MPTTISSSSVGCEVPAERGARVYGTITHWERNLVTGEPVEHGPVRDVIVTVRGSVRAIEGITGVNGWQRSASGLPLRTWHAPDVL